MRPSDRQDLTCPSWLYPVTMGVLDAPRTARSTRTPHGLVSSRWRLEDGVLTLDAVLPEGVTGIVSLPGEPDVEVTGAARVVG